MKRQEQTSGSLWPVILVLLAALATWGAVAGYKEVARRQALRMIWNNEEHADRHIFLIRNALQTFRSTYPSAVRAWDGTVAGLNAYVPTGKEMPAHLIPDEIANADPSRAHARPLHGYWFVLIEANEDKAGDPQGAQSQMNKTICAYPAEYRNTGFNTFLLTGDGWFKMDTRGVPPKVTPSLSELKLQWSTCRGG